MHVGVKFPVLLFQPKSSDSSSNLFYPSVSHATMLMWVHALRVQSNFHINDAAVFYELAIPQKLFRVLRNSTDKHHFRYDMISTMLHNLKSNTYSDIMRERSHQGRCSEFTIQKIVQRHSVHKYCQIMLDIVGSA